MGVFKPFLVADRPASLRIIRGADPQQYPNGLGIMTHANVSDNVAEFVREFPASGGFYDRHDDYEQDDESRYVTADGSLTGLGQEIREQTVRICDSGAFNKEGSQFDDYETLFARYEEMGVDYGIILDVLNDPEATLTEAQKALATYEAGPEAGEYSFDLIGVAQGTLKDEYLECYESLRELGYDYIAIGGLLSKHGERSGAFAHIEDEVRMERILRSIRDAYPTDWLFALGSHHPDRHALFNQLDLFGADYKGWIYKYTPQFNDTLKAREWRYRNVRCFLKQNAITGTDYHPSSLLILPCSKTKRDNEERLPAIERYNGQYYLVYKKWRREIEEPDDRVDVLILSAKYGLLQPGHLIHDYDERLDEALSGEELSEVAANLFAYLKYRDYEDILLVGGQPYRDTVRTCLEVFQRRGIIDANLEECSQPIGKQLQRVGEWLRAQDPSVSSIHQETAIAD